MRAGKISSIVVLCGVALVCVMLAGVARAETDAEIEALNARVIELYNAGKYDEAIPVAERVAAATLRKYGDGSSEYTTALNNLAALLQDTNRLTEAERLYRRALAISETSFGPEHTKVAIGLNNLAHLLKATNRLAEAERLYRRALAIDEKSYGPEHPTVAARLSNLAQLLQATNRLTEAEPLMRRALAIDEKSYGPEHSNVARGLNNLAGLLQATNRLAEAEPLMRRALAIDEKSYGPEHPDVARDLNNLAGLLQDTNRLTEAEPLYRRALAIDEKSYGPEHPKLAIDLNNLARLLQDTNRLTEAEPLYRRVIVIFEKALGVDHPNVATALNNLATLLHATNRFAEAEPLMRRVVVIFEKALGTDNPNVATALNNLAQLLKAANRPAESEPLMRRALAIDETNYGPQHPKVAIRLNNLGGFRAEIGDWSGAAALHRRAVPIMTADNSPALGGRADLGRAILAQNTRQLRAAARAVNRADATDLAAVAEGFDLAQWAVQTSAATALAQMSVRFATGTGPLVALVRERQDLSARREGEDKRLLAAVGAGNAEVAASIHDSLAKIDADLGAIDARLAKDFPDYAALSAPKPLSITDAQDLLAEDETLLLFLDIPKFSRLPEETLAWAVTKTDVRWTSISLGTSDLRERVERIRCGLDATSWTDPSSWPEDSDAIKIQKAAQQARRDVCKALLGLDASDSDPPPFDLATAHELYNALFDQFADMIPGKRLLIAASGPLARLPFGALVREPPKVSIGRTAQDFQDVAWLAKSSAITVLPSVASLAALRKLAKDSAPAPEPFLGVGNPLLDGNPRNHGDVRRAEEARARQVCTKATASAEEPWTFKLAHVPIIGALFRGGVAEVAELRRQAPLPETADELCAIAATLGAPESAVLLGANATETAVKARSESGGLAQARIVHFATHGLLAGESEAFLKAGAEPGLILTPPTTASEADDGLLGASEVAQLKLNAEWVVLSACNTAGGEASDAEALSGLARAFFYAGAKALLVTHWAVDSDAAVRLTTRAFAALRANPAIGRAEAFRQSVVAMMSEKRPKSWTPAAHPAVWAPFVLVGGGSG